MTRQVRARWSIPLVTALTVVALGAMFTAGVPAARLLDRHSQPARRTQVDEVVVTPEGKLFHRPGCRFIHGSPHLRPAAATRAAGLSPCPRCLGGLGAGTSGLAGTRPVPPPV